MITNILLRHNYIAIPDSDGHADIESLATVMMNLSYYGFALNTEAYNALTKLSTNDMSSWWSSVEASLKEFTGDDKNIGDFVVYKNFPEEVLKKSDAEYWIPQILIYWGFPKEFFTEEVKPREQMNEKVKQIVLQLAKKDTLLNILNSYLRSPARWKDEEFKNVLFLADRYSVSVALISFKENLVRLAESMIQKNQCLNITTATDALRLAAGISACDVSLREKVKFISFKKSMRRFLLSTLEKCHNLEEDMARRPDLWKKLIHQLHPGDYKRQFPRVCSVMDDLYKDNLHTFNARIEALILKKDIDTITLLKTRPGDFRRRLAHMLTLFGTPAEEAFVSNEVLSKLTTYQLVSMRRYLETVNSRTKRVFPPKGNWNKLQLGDPRKLDEKSVQNICSALDKAITDRLPKVKYLDPNTDMVKLPNNGEVSQYARGTAFPIPENVQFIRTASYWQKAGKYNTWFDNGWNFFNSDWKNLGTCCWDAKSFQDGAIFSGDPTNSKEMNGKACQMIDLYIPELKRLRVRYAVWNILCYSNVPFSDAEDVFAALQWGVDRQKGNLFEPSRCQIAFQLKSKQLTKYICVLDLEKMQMIYLDANLDGKVHSAKMNGKLLEKNMPAYMEYINSLPSVHDLFRNSVSNDAEIQVVYSDKDVSLNGELAYVFKPENQENKYKPVDINGLL